MSKLRLLSPTEYVEDATERINSATERVVLLAMIVADQSLTHELIDALIIASNRGVKVYVAADVFMYGEIGGSFAPIRYYSKPSRVTTSMGKLLKRSGVKFYWLGRNHMTIFSGRTHSKWCIVDDTVYSFGGVNMYDIGIESADYMFKIESAVLANRLYEEHTQLVNAERTGRLFKSHQFDFNNDHVLIDGGILWNSLIYQRACDLANSAKTVTFVSQYPPTGKLSRIFKLKNSKMYFNKPERANFVNGLMIRASILTTNVQTLYQREPYLHAKFIIFYMPDGSRVALTGTHNYNYSTVVLGTREVALETRDPQVIDQLEAFLEREIA